MLRGVGSFQGLTQSRRPGEPPDGGLDGSEGNEALQGAGKVLGGDFPEPGESAPAHLEILSQPIDLA